VPLLSPVLGSRSAGRTSTRTTPSSCPTVTWSSPRGTRGASPIGRSCPPELGELGSCLHQPARPHGSVLRRWASDVACGQRVCGGGYVGLGAVRVYKVTPNTPTHPNQQKNGRGTRVFAFVRRSRWRKDSDTNSNPCSLPRWSTRHRSGTPCRLETKKRPRGTGPAPPADIQPVRRKVTQALRAQMRDARAEATARARQLHSQMQQARPVSPPNPQAGPPAAQLASAGAAAPSHRSDVAHHLPSSFCAQTLASGGDEQLVEQRH
jgi:hypothetical protein